MSFKEKTVIISGGASGIGAAAVHEFVADGARVYILDIIPPRVSRDTVTFFECDVRSYAQIENAIKEISSKEEKIDCLVACAGIHFSGSIEDTDLETFERVLSTNFKGVFYVLKCVLPIVRQQGHGSIVLVGSDQSLIGKKKSAIYGATKGAIGQLTKSTALDYAEYGIRVNCVCPGAIDTPLCDGALRSYLEKFGSGSKEDLLAQLKEKHPLKRIGSSEEVAHLIHFLCSDKASFITGTLVSVDGGYVAQ